MKFRLRILNSLADIGPSAWDALHASDNPFLRHAFLSGLESTGCLRPEWGWTPCHATLWDGDVLVAAAPAYLKANSHGEFVFDQAWADAYARHGRRYYPKWLVGIPYTPVAGPRLLAANPAQRAALVQAMAGFASERGLSSIHVNFIEAAETEALPAPWLPRQTVQFHWRNRGWRDFEDFLASLQSKKRKNIRQERAKVAAAGYRFRVAAGSDITDADLHTMHGFYQGTFAQYGNHPALTAGFFDLLAARMPEALVLVLAERGGVTCAGALFLRGGDTLYGRYWGSSEHSPGLHFETCYYQGIEYCLREGLTCFEPGAQGEHKIARGFLPSLTHSRHWLREPAFGAALQPWCEAETRMQQQYAEAARQAGPYRE